MSSKSRERKYYWVTERQLQRLMEYEHRNSRLCLVNEIKKRQSGKQAEAKKE